MVVSTGVKVGLVPRVPYASLMAGAQGGGAATAGVLLGVNSSFALSAAQEAAGAGYAPHVALALPQAHHHHHHHHPLQGPGVGAGAAGGAVMGNGAGGPGGGGGGGLDAKSLLARDSGASGGLLSGPLGGGKAAEAKGGGLMLLPLSKGPGAPLGGPRRGGAAGAAAGTAACLLDKGTGMMVAVAFMWSVTASLDKLGVLHAPSVWVYFALQRLVIGAASVAYLVVRAPRAFRLLFSRHVRLLLLISACETLAVVLFLVSGGGGGGGAAVRLPVAARRATLAALACVHVAMRRRPSGTCL